MKTIYAFLTMVAVASPLAALDQGALSAVAQKFSGTTADEQYLARVELNRLIDTASTPGTGDRAAVTTTLLAVLAAADTPAEAKKYIVRSLANTGTAAAVPALTDMLNGTDARLQEEALQALELIPGDAATASLAAALDAATDGRSKVSLANALATKKATSAIPALAKLVSDADADVAQAAIEALARIGGQPAIDALLAGDTASSDVGKALLIASSGSAEVARQVYTAATDSTVKAAALAALKDSALIDTALQSDDAILRRTALQTGLASGQQSVQQLVTSAYGDLSTDERLLVLAHLDLVQPADAAAQLALTSAAAEDTAEKAAALRALRSADSQEAFAATLAGLADRDRNVSDAASIAIAAMPYAAAESELVAMLKGDNSDAKRNAIKAATYRKIDGLNAILIDIVKGSDKNAGKDALKMLFTTATVADLEAIVSAAKASTDTAQQKMMYAASKKIAERIGTDAATKLVEGL